MNDRNSDRTPVVSGSAHAPDAPVGYKRPPMHTRFKPGRSGNQRGRRLGAKGRKQIVEAIAKEKHKVMEAGVARQRTTLELVLLSIRSQSVEGRVRAFRAHHDLLQRYAPQRLGSQHPVAVLPAGPVTLEEWVKMSEERRRRVDKIVESRRKSRS